eukprot:m.60152 g.60152  ORF g.60152 m.60152 type:complete len:352 (-) comp11358_c0_seq1:2434-3489(-)
MPKLSVDDELLQEYNEDSTVVAEKAAKIAQSIKSAHEKGHRVVIFTGAGISTAAKIPDYRGPKGVWTCRDKGIARPKGVKMERAQPTYTHRAIKKLVDLGICTLVVSQNVDCLHLKSGVPESKLCELHGNSFKEKCVDCGQAYLRDIPCRRKKGPYFKGVVDERSESGISHITGRKCGHCQDMRGRTGMLRDSVIHFRESLDEAVLDKAWMTCQGAKVVLCIGSSLSVTPAADMPILCKSMSGKMHIVNLQKTVRDFEAFSTKGEVLHCKCDKAMKEIMKQLDISVDNCDEIDDEDEVVVVEELKDAKPQKGKTKKKKLKKIRENGMEETKTCKTTPKGKKEQGRHAIAIA